MMEQDLTLSRVPQKPKLNRTSSPAQELIKSLLIICHFKYPFDDSLSGKRMHLINEQLNVKASHFNLLCSLIQDSDSELYCNTSQNAFHLQNPFDSYNYITIYT
uniref:Uncharacterized protein n=1 Tax=Onchocerca volvulus TaxID=6282 RepID=A0A8R1TXU7_ONCVO